MRLARLVVGDDGSPGGAGGSLAVSPTSALLDASDANDADLPVVADRALAFAPCPVVVIAGTAGPDDTGDRPALAESHTAGR